MSDTILDLAYRLTQSGEPFVLATVVWCERPTSAKPGNRAIVQANGEITGWIGGSCAQPLVLREAMRVLREGGDPYLLRLGAPDRGFVRDDVRIFPMTCASGGLLDIYMEPHIPKHLLLIGDSPVIAALGRLASVLDFTVIHIDHADLSQVPVSERTYVLIATHGYYDEDALEQALRSSARYVGMVCSHKRAATCRDYLRGSGLTEAQIARLKVPAGLDLGGITPEEIAASILAELVQVHRRGVVTQSSSMLFTEEQPVVGANGGSSASQEQPVAVSPPSQEQPVVGVDANSLVSDTAIDPVCDMIVEVATARHHSKHEGRDFYFCCPACKRAFERNPQEYLVRHER